ncbi:hypothetical protein BS47DRAFT_1380246 [Hydnum rufescens UP504]|uniref:Uncharacterized protein n=1 Tax=Hydnum rufescens UP504 TaxID=1448309 RepID=A0A9P6B5N2_9AGAM|nr:hypothetical protein BS47DRAFT_1380246 [Hydnum rufescens UP504]
MHTYISPEFVAFLEYLSLSPDTSSNPEEWSLPWTEAPPPLVSVPWFRGIPPGPNKLIHDINQQTMRAWSVDSSSTLSTNGALEDVPGPSHPSVMVQRRNHTEGRTYDYGFDFERGQHQYPDTLQRTAFGDSPIVSGGVPYPVTTTLASASHLNTTETPSPEGESPGEVLQSQGIAGLEGGVNDTSSPSARPPRRKLRDGQLLIAQQIVDRILEEIKRCDDKDMPHAERLECGSCYRKRLDGGRKGDRQYYRPELNALVETSTREGWVLKPKEGVRISSNIEFIPSTLLWVEDHLCSHLESKRRRSKREVPRRGHAPRPWRVEMTEDKRLIVFREGEVIVA